MSASDDNGPTPGTDIADVLQPGVPQRPRPLSETASLVLNVVAAMNDAGDDVEERYKEALSVLRGRANDAIIEIARLENHCRSADYSTRWGLIHAASELQHPAALPFFRSVVLTPIPPEGSPDPHSFSTVQEETILRTTAVDGVARLAAPGSEEAVEALFAFLAVPSFSVKRAAVQGLLAVKKGESLRERIESHLCPEDRFLLEIRPIDVHRATQIDDPTAHLSEDGRSDAKASAPDLPDRAGLRKEIPEDEGPKTRGKPRRKED